MRSLADDRRYARRATPAATLRSRSAAALRASTALAIMAGLVAVPAAHGQLLRMRGAITTPPVTTAPPIVGVVRPATQREAIERAAALRTRAETIRTFVTSARAASAAATARPPVIDGLGIAEGPGGGGLRPFAAIREAVRLANSASPADRAQAQVLLAASNAANDSLGTRTWDGVGLPTQTTDGGRTVVTLVQNQSRALASWDSFDIGANTSFNVVQRAAGVAQPGWTLVNRVADSIAPSQILGNINADGTVLVLNRAGVIFGANSQVALHSLLASTLEIGNFRQIGSDTAPATSLRNRNLSFLQDGLFNLTSSTALLPPFLLSSLVTTDAQGDVVSPAVEGAVEVDAGARITANSGGFIILAGPKVTNSGALSAVDGQISLIGGRFITAAISTGGTGSVDPGVRGYILRVAGTTGLDGTVVNDGLIDSKRGYISLDTGLLGSVTNNGLLAATTSVSRNGKIALHAGLVTLGGNTATDRASGITILPDDNGETIPRGTADEPPAFIRSNIEIGGLFAVDLASPTGQLVPTLVDFGQNSLLLAPGADVIVGRRADEAPELQQLEPSRITIATGAVLDVSGVKGVEVAVARNVVTISPVKRNELRDTPNYRESNTTGAFTLNGSTLSVDVRRSGVREDGVRWVGSPLLEAGSAASQITVTAAELLTKAGTISLAVNPIVNTTASADSVPSVRIAAGATIDISGGFVTYLPGTIATSKLRTADGRLIDIADADPNDIFVAVVDGFTDAQPRFGVDRNFAGIVLPQVQADPGYDEGSDAGALSISAAAIGFDGTVFGQAFAGRRQIATATLGSQASAFTGDPRRLQGDASQLPASGFVRIGSFLGANQANLGADILVYHGTRGSVAADLGEILINDALINNAGLSALTLQTSGAISFAGAAPATLQPPGVLTITGASEIVLAPGGALRLDAGRAIRLDGRITAASGSITAQTLELAQPSQNTGAIAGQAAAGSPFRSDDDLVGLYAVGTALPAPFDLTVTGTLDVAGLFTNPVLAADTIGGRAYLDGGSIDLRVAPKVLVALGDSLATATRAGDLSGRINIDPAARLDLTAGAYVLPDRSFDFSGVGGNLSLINQTVYASLVPTVRVTSSANPVGNAQAPIAGTTQSVGFTPLAAGEPPLEAQLPQLMPDVPRAAVSFSSDSISAFGFAGGGSFNLEAPDIAFGSDPRSAPARIGLDFYARTGFGSVSATSYRSRFVDSLFSNGRSGNSAFLATSSFRIGRGETLDLSQTLLPSVLGQAESDALLGLASGGRVASVLTPAIPTALFDQRGANLTLGGLTELVVAAGGAITAAPQATITVPKLAVLGSTDPAVAGGRITLPAGTIQQVAVLPLGVGSRLLEVRDASGDGSGTRAALAQAFGVADADGRFDETGPNGAGIPDPGNPGALLSNRDLVTAPATERFVYFVGDVATATGIRLDSGSSVDLSGVAIFDPRAPLLGATASVPTRQLRFGRVLGGGRIATAAPRILTQGLLFASDGFLNPRQTNTSSSPPAPIASIIPGRSFEALPGSLLSLAGTSATVDDFAGAGSFVATPQWSNGGTLSVLAGGSIFGSSIDANGGDARAIGGTLEWRRPLLSDSDAGSPADRSLRAADIMAAGFDTLVARGALSFAGTVVLRLDKALLVAPEPLDGGLDRALPVTINAAGANGAITAPYIRFESILGVAGSGPQQLTPDAGSVRFTATASGLDIVGGLSLATSVASASFVSNQDIRLTGVNTATNEQLPRLDGGIRASGDLNFTAQRTYATTGTGNLQRVIEELAAGRTGTGTNPLPLPYLINTGRAATIRFDAVAGNTAIPLSAGSYLRINAGTIIQNGNLYAPLGVLEIGADSTTGRTLLGRPIGESQIGQTVTPTDRVSLGAGSITSVTANGALIPYGTTTDQTDFLFTPTTSLPLTRAPVGELRLAGAVIDIAAASDGLAAATVDGRGGGEIFGFEFISGIGGSRDVLDRISRDVFSSNNYNPATGTGLQYADGRQVFAILPTTAIAGGVGSIALQDPVYSADYGSAGPVNLFGEAAGRTVRLEAGPGFAAGEYLLLPAHYALLPGGLRVVEVESAAAVPGVAQTQLDGSVIVSGQFATAGTNFLDSTQRSFLVQDQAVVGRAARIVTTSGSDAVRAAAVAADRVLPRLPLDAARIVLSPLAQLSNQGLFTTAAATDDQGRRGRGSEVDIGGVNIVVSNTAATTAGVLTLTPGDLAALNANSLFIGGSRSDNADGTTTLGNLASNITIDNGVTLTFAELLLAVESRSESGAIRRGELRIGDDVVLAAQDLLDNAATGAYLVGPRAAPIGASSGESNAGAVLRIANGPERVVRRTFTIPTATQPALRVAELPAILATGAATFAAQTVLLDSTRDLVIGRETSLAATGNLLLGGDQIRFGGVFLSAAQQAQIAATPQLTLQSPAPIGFASGSYAFRNLVINAPGISTLSANAAVTSDVSLTSTSLRLRNDFADLTPCTLTGAARACGSAGSSLTIATGELVFDNGQFATFGFDRAVAIAATAGTYVEGNSGFDVGGATLALTTPLIADRARTDMLPGAGDRPAIEFATTSSLTIDAGGAAALAPTGIRAPGARIAFGSLAAPLAALSITDTAVLATAGQIEAQTRGDIVLAGRASLATPGFTRTYADSLDSGATLVAGGGTITLFARGGIALADGTALNVDSGIGRAGALNLIAGSGAIALGGSFADTFNRGIAASRTASLTFDSAVSAFDLGGFVAGVGNRFGGDLVVRSGSGDLTLGVGQALTARSVSLTADGGAIAVAGTIRTVGTADAPDGGDITLFGATGLTLASSARLDTHTEGYASNDERIARAGDVKLGIGGLALGDPRLGTSAAPALTIADGAQIDVGARRTEAAPGLDGRLVTLSVRDPFTLVNTIAFRFVEADSGGNVILRAPSAADHRLNIALPATNVIRGARSQVIEGVRTYDLDRLGGDGSGISLDTQSNTINFNLIDGYSQVDGTNIFASSFVDTSGALPFGESIPFFIQNFTASDASGAGFNGFRLRPAVNLVSARNVQLISNWNLGAGIVDQRAAQADGVLVAIPQLNFGFRADTPPEAEFGEAYLAVAAGREADLVANYTRFVYRTNGGAADGEAPVITVRAGGDARLFGSVTDGFFVFRDRADPFFISYQLGGGERQVLPAATFTCATLASGDCGSSVVGDFITLARDGGAEPANSALINLTQIVGGSDIAPTAPAPFSQRANNPGAEQAFDLEGNFVGDPIGVAELFPVIGNGATTIRSSDIQIVAGAAETSANPLQLDRAVTAEIRLASEVTYQVRAIRGASTYIGPAGLDPLLGIPTGPYRLDLRITPLVDTSETRFVSAAADLGFIAAAANAQSSTGLAVGSSEELYTVITWGAGNSDRNAFVRNQALGFFENIDPAGFDFASYEALDTAGRDAFRVAGDKRVGIFQGPRNSRTGIAVRLNDALAFLAEIGPEFAGNVVNGRFQAGTPLTRAPIDFGLGRTAYAGNVIRTGDGNIALAASGNVELTRSPEIVYRSDNNLGPANNRVAVQVGGSAVYTAGTRLTTATAITARTADGSVTAALGVTGRPVLAPILEAEYIPSPRGQFFVTPTLARDGGNVAITAGADIIGRRDVWAETNLGTGADYSRQTLGRFGNATRQDVTTIEGLSTLGATVQLGTDNQRWRVGTIGQDTTIAINPQFFTAGVAALAGGDVALNAGGVVLDLTIALTSTEATANPRIANSQGFLPQLTATGTEAPILASFGSGSLALATGGDLAGGLIDIAAGTGRIDVGGSVRSETLEVRPASAGITPPANDLRLRLRDAQAFVTARESVSLNSLSALGAGDNAFRAIDGAFGATAAATITANANIELTFGGVQVLAPSVALVSVDGDIVTNSGSEYLLYPSARGGLTLLAGGNLDRANFAILDSEPSLLPGIFSAFGALPGGASSPDGGLLTTSGLSFFRPGTLNSTTASRRRLRHDPNFPQAGNPDPIRVAVGGDITDSIFIFNRQSRISAGGDIVNLYFTGQNLAASDLTRVTAGRDITSTLGTSDTNLPFVRSNNFTLGGPGSFSVEAGRNLGPFISSGNVGGSEGAVAGGIRTVGNLLNPFLPNVGADLLVGFGIANGADYVALRTTYLDPANLDRLDGDLFVQVFDANGNASPNRAQPVYAPILATWLRDNDPAGFTAIFGTTSFPDTDAGRAALAAAAYPQFAALTARFASLPLVNQRDFLINNLYFNELSQPVLPTSPSFQQFIRSYRAVDTLFGPALGYTDNLAAYDLDPATITPDNPLGVPRRRLDANGQPLVADRVQTGNADLRLATWQTARGGDLTILAPGGDLIAGSVVRLQQQLLQRQTANRGPLEIGDGGRPSIQFQPTGFPLGFEGLLTLNGGTIRGFTDGDLRLNQSRVFAFTGNGLPSDINLFSANGDLNAGQGPRTAASFPPVTVRFDPDGLGEVDSAGSVAGSGIGTFQRAPTDPVSSILLVAPVGEIDAGDAGVRASGNIFAQAARFANADNFSAGGTISGVPTSSAGPSVAVSSSSNVAGLQATSNAASASNTDRRSIITVDVLGAIDPCADPKNTDPNCVRPPVGR